MPLTILATSLTRPALRADSAGAGADDFIAAAMRAGDVHEHPAQRSRDAIGVGVAI